MVASSPSHSHFFDVACHALGVAWRRFYTTGGSLQADLCYDVPYAGSLSNLVSLNLNNNSLQSLPPDIHLLTNLHVLSASNNQLHQLPDELCSLLQLTELHVDGNKLTSLPHQMGQLRRLRKLMLQKNRLTTLTHVSSIHQYSMCVQ